MCWGISDERLLVFSEVYFPKSRVIAVREWRCKIVEHRSHIFQMMQNRLHFHVVAYHDRWAFRVCLTYVSLFAPVRILEMTPHSVLFGVTAKGKYCSQPSLTRLRMFPDTFSQQMRQGWTGRSSSCVIFLISLNFNDFQLLVKRGFDDKAVEQVTCILPDQSSHQLRDSYAAYWSPGKYGLLFSF